MNDNPKVDSQHSDYDLYASLVLYNLLDSEQVTTTTEPTIEEKSIEDISNDVIWVPADKHPEIAPIEFANFIKTHGANTPTRRSSSLHRRKSILSQSLTSTNENSMLKEDKDQDDEHLNRTLSEKKRLFLKRVLANSEQLRDINTQVFDRNSTATDDSRIIVPRTDRSLLRRSAFSARGRSRKHGHVEDRQQLAEKRRSVSQRKPSASHSINDSIKSTKTNDSWDKSQGVSLFDQPVNLSEWIDLGSASLESDDSQRGILSRVHDAESQLRSQIDNDSSLEKEHEQEEKCIITDDPVPKTNQPDVTFETDKSNVAATTAKVEGMKRPDIIRSEPEKMKIPLSKVIVTKPEKKSSWLGGFFNDKKNERKHVNAATKKTSSTVITTSTNSSLSGFASLFTRSLSMKSSQLSHSSTNNRNSAKPKPGKVNTNQAKSQPIITSTTTTTNNTNNNTLTDTKKKRSSRLEIPPPSERTFFNSNRLPLHVERAIYRLSHMKLADPRRPLHQQVLISNLMFWYLSIQQNDFQHVNTEQRVETDSPPAPDTQQKKGGKMSRLIHSAKRRRNEVAQFVQAYPLSNSHQQENPSRPPLKQSNVQFSLPPIPSHQSVLTDDIEEEDNVPLSHYRS